MGGVETKQRYSLNCHGEKKKIGLPGRLYRSIEVLPAIPGQI